jgi:hypothetical protein
MTVNLQNFYILDSKHILIISSWLQQIISCEVDIYFSFSENNDWTIHYNVHHRQNIFLSIK